MFSSMERLLKFKVNPLKPRNYIKSTILVLFTSFLLYCMLTTAMVWFPQEKVEGFVITFTDGSTTSIKSDFVRLDGMLLRFYNVVNKEVIIIEDIVLMSVRSVKPTHPKKMAFKF